MVSSILFSILDNLNSYARGETAANTRYWEVAHSAISHHIPIKTGCGFKQGGTTDIYLGAQVNVGADHKVCQPSHFVPYGMIDCVFGGVLTFLVVLFSFMQHPETLLPMPTVDDPVQRFISVVKFYLSGWHIKSPCAQHPTSPQSEKQLH
jgi:hypothetical protein